jgi:hypothetical protein
MRTERHRLRSEERLFTRAEGDRRDEAILNCRWWGGPFWDLSGESLHAISMLDAAFL